MTKTFLLNFFSRQTIIMKCATKWLLLGLLHGESGKLRFSKQPSNSASKSFSSHLLKYENCILSYHQPDTQFANKVEISYQSVVLNAWHVPLCIHILNDSLSSLESHILSLKEELYIPFEADDAFSIDLSLNTRWVPSKDYIKQISICGIEIEICTPSTSYGGPYPWYCMLLRFWLRHMDKR